MKNKLLMWVMVLFVVLFVGCGSDEYTKDRESAIPNTAVKVSPDEDNFPPVVLSDEYGEPVPLNDMVNTAGAEDSPFIFGDTLFFFFTPDVNVPAQDQLIDSVTGIWFCIKEGNSWTEAERIILNDDVALDGAVFVWQDTMWFASVRAGNYGEVDFYKAVLKDGDWTDWQNAGELLNETYDIGELHITYNGDTMYFGWEDENGYGLKDLCFSVRDGDSWTQPQNCGDIVNSELNEDQPYISKDGNELWFTGQSRSGYTGPSLYRCVKINGEWSEPEEMIANFAGEPTLDDDGNVYFVHHFYTTDLEMIEADIYYCGKK